MPHSNFINEIPVFFAVDDKYAPYLGVSLYSAIEHSSSARRYRAIILYRDLSEENRRKISSLAKEHFAVELIPMDHSLEMITDCERNRLNCDYFTLTIFFRLFIPKMFPQYNKGIYIDCDTVLCSDIAELYDTDIGEMLIGGCTDLSVADLPEIVSYMENAIGVPREEYINSGVLLLNMKKLRELGFDEHFLELLTRFHPDSIAPDQDYINAMCNGQIFYLDREWDVMPNERHPVCPDPKLIHYNLFYKPWRYDGIQYGDKFWDSAERTEFYPDIVRYKSDYGEEKKQSDRDCLALLLARGDLLASSDHTFRRLHERGERVRI